MPPAASVTAQKSGAGQETVSRWPCGPSGVVSPTSSGAGPGQLTIPSGGDRYHYDRSQQAHSDKGLDQPISTAAVENRPLTVPSRAITRTHLPPLGSPASSTRWPAVSRECP